MDRFKQNMQNSRIQKSILNSQVNLCRWETKRKCQVCQFPQTDHN